jgi:hypothetical protein
MQVTSSRSGLYANNSVKRTAFRCRLPRALYGMSEIAQLDEYGFFEQPNVLSGSDCDHLATEIMSVTSSGAGTRNLLSLPWCNALAKSLKRHPSLSPFVSVGCVAVQCTLFAKTPGTNWSVMPHQDLSIPVASKVDTPHCSGWSEKEGSLFTQPPVAVLNACVAVRLHVDACGPEAGPLVVAPGSHKLGRLPSPAVAQLFASQGRHVCAVPRGGALVLRPLLAHASSKAVASVNRRVLHFLFGPVRLPFGLQWAYAV